MLHIPCYPIKGDVTLKQYELHLNLWLQCIESSSSSPAAYLHKHCVTSDQLMTTYLVSFSSHSASRQITTPLLSYLFHLSFSTGEVLVHSQAVEEDLERLIHLAHLMQHHSFAKQSLKGQKGVVERDQLYFCARIYVCLVYSCCW